MNYNHIGRLKNMANITVNLNSSPPFFHSCTSYLSEIHA